MKAAVIFLSIFSLAIHSTIAQDTEDKLAIGWYLEAQDKSKAMRLTDYFTGDTIYVNPKPILLASDYRHSGFRSENRDGKLTHSISLVYDGDHKQKWADTTKEMAKDRSLAYFVYKGEAICRLTTMKAITNGYTRIMNENLSREFLKQVFSDIKSQR